MRKYLEEGQAAPRGYGLAYRDYEYCRAIIYPVPFHWIVSFSRRFWFAAVKNKHWQTGYDKGYQRGNADGNRYGTHLAYSQTMRRELPDILKRYSDESLKQLGKPRDDKTIDGWALRFIEKELKRMEQP